MDSKTNEALKTRTPRRLYGLDVLKLLIVIVIVTFHVWENLMYRDQMALPLSESLYTYYGIIFATLFHYGGPFLLAISFFLFGYRDSRFSFFKWSVLLIGILMIQYNAESFSEVSSLKSWNWDVYSFLALSYVVVYLSPRKNKFRFLLVLASTIFLLFSPAAYSEFFSQTFGLLKPVLILDTAKQIPNGWFLLPWIFLPLLMFNLGHLIRAAEGSLSKLRAWEIPIFLIVFLALYVGTDPVPFLAGPRFNEFVFWQSPAFFWMHFLFLLFYIRLQFAKRIQNFFESPIFHFISKLAWVQHLWFCYLFHFMMIQIFEVLYNRHQDAPYILDFIILATLLSTELVGDFLFFLHSKRQKAIQS